MVGSSEESEEISDMLPGLRLDSMMDFSSSVDFPSSHDSLSSQDESKDLSQRLSAPLLASEDGDERQEEKHENHSFAVLRVTYLLVTLVIMLADGLQGENGIS